MMLGNQLEYRLAQLESQLAQQIAQSRNSTQQMRSKIKLIEGIESVDTI